MNRLVVFSDVLCPWATVVVLRLHAARARARADDELAIVHRALPLELLRSGRSRARCRRDASTNHA